MPEGPPELRSGKRPKSSRAASYVWTAVLVTVAVVVVVISWHAGGGTTDPTSLPPGHRLSHGTVVIDSAILVFREGLETILVLAAVTASFLGGNRIYRRPVAAGACSPVWRCSASPRCIASASRS